MICVACGKGDNKGPGIKMDCVLNLVTPIVRESRDSIRTSVASDCPDLLDVSPKE